MTQLTIKQWLLSQLTQTQGNNTMSQAQEQRYVIVTSNRFYGHYDVLDTQTQTREPCGNLRTARQTMEDKNNNK